MQSAKPRITLSIQEVRQAYPDFVWRCSTVGGLTEWGYGRTPKAAYEAWRKHGLR